MPRILEAEALHTAADTLPPRHGGKSDGRLYRRGQSAQIEEAKVDGRAQPERHQRREQQPQQREQHESAGHHHQMQSPVTQPRQQVLARQLGTVHEKQECHRQLGQQTEPDGYLPLAGEEGGQSHHGNQHRSKGIQTHKESPSEAHPASTAGVRLGEGNKHNGKCLTPPVETNLQLTVITRLRNGQWIEGN